MTDYEGSRWANTEFADNYTNSADDIILERGKLIEGLKSFYGHFLHGRGQVRVLDLGCGDGTLTYELTGEYPNITPTLVDGSAGMLAKAKKLLGVFKGAEFVQASFQQLLRSEITLSKFEFVFSSLAIHHLEASEKAAIFGYIHEHLEAGGYFLNIDVVLPPSAELEGWYLRIWREWIDRRCARKGFRGETDIPSQYKGNPDNKPDTLSSQLAALEGAGFVDVDCCYKYGIFAIFGGRKAGADQGT